MASEQSPPWRARQTAMAFEFVYRDRDDEAAPAERGMVEGWDEEEARRLIAADTRMKDKTIIAIRRPSVTGGLMHEHRYSVTECPECGHDLTAEGGVTIESYREGVGHGLVPSRLDEAGLLEDAFNLVEAGLHSDTICGKCGESLAEYETGED